VSITPCLRSKGGFFCTFIQWLSYLFPIKLQNVSSQLSGPIDLRMVRGRVEVNTKNANYSFGNLHHIFQDICKKYEKEIASASNILILGFGAGSIYQILRTNHNYKGAITGVEVDTVMIQLFHSLFPYNDQKLRLFQKDALQFIKHSHPEPPYDLIFIDLFVDTKHCDLLLDNSFIRSLKVHLSNNGLILMNTMFPTPQQTPLHQMMQIYSNTFKSVKRHPVMDCNHIFAIRDILSYP
jgi:spermidine synthase